MLSGVLIRTTTTGTSCVRTLISSLGGVLWTKWLFPSLFMSMYFPVGGPKSCWIRHKFHTYAYLDRSTSELGTKML